MIYLDTGCFVKLYYPEPDSAQVIALVHGERILYTPLHELEFVNALELKVFARGATPSQAAAALALVESDLEAGVLTPVSGNWNEVFRIAVELAGQHTAALGSRSLDVLHCAMAKVLNVAKFITTDGRQKRLAATIGLNLESF